MGAIYGRFGPAGALQDGMEYKPVLNQPKLILSLEEAADLLGMPSHRLYEHTRARSRARQRIPIPHLRLGRRLAFRRESLEKWVAELEAETGVRQ